MVVLQDSVNNSLSVSGEHVPFIMDGMENSVPLKFTVCAPISQSVSMPYVPGLPVQSHVLFLMTSLSREVTQKPGAEGSSGKQSKRQVRLEIVRIEKPVKPGWFVLIEQSQ